MKKDTRSSKDRVATYGQKMKALGYKQVSFYMSPKAHTAITKLTVETKRLNASLASTNNTLFESLLDKYFVYQAITNTGSPDEVVAAIELTIKMFNVMLEEEKKRKLECQKEVEFMVENDLMPTPDEIASTIEAEELLLRQGLD